jgi:ketosteroid isomerase-like protein
MADTLSTVDLLHAYVERLEGRDWAGVADLLHEDVVYLLPQTGEVVRGRDAYLAWNQNYPEGWHLRLAEAYGDDTGGAARIDAVAEGEPVTALVFVTVSDGLLTEIRDWWPTSYDAPPRHGD